MRYVLPIIIIIVAALSLIVFAYRQIRFVEEDANALMTKFANQAVERAIKEYSRSLDYSPSSVEQVESILSDLHEKHLAQPFPEERLSKEANTWGAYIGEVAKRLRAGVWHRDSKVVGKGAMPLVHDTQNESYPLSWVYNRITNGPEDNVWNKFQGVYYRKNLKQLDLNELMREAERK